MPHLRVPSMLIWSILVFSATLVAADGQLPALDQAAAEKISFRNDVQPILKRHCWGCHSAAKPEGGLRLDTVAAMLKGSVRQH